MDTVYIETTIPSTYFEQRTNANIVARREWTRDWWDKHRQRYRVVSSVPVVDELSRGEHPLRSDKLELIKDLELLEPNDAIANIVEVYIERYVMPCDPSGDALHLALASYFRCDFLLTWNCIHLANANKLGHIRIVNTLLGLHIPQIVTPLELLGEDTI
ncbi:MAG: type II toxin-antitoxin system VapC family toxin [Rhodobacteraceae bacterium]|nr:type II toxin-antitoxin system VapC family toxin [Paracoccaceae bacterium]